MFTSWYRAALTVCAATLVLSACGSAEEAADSRGAEPLDEVTILAAAAANNPETHGRVARNREELGDAWEAVEAVTAPPSPPDGYGVLVVAVGSNTCRSPNDVLGVEVDDDRGVVILDPDGEFTRPCPGPQGVPRGTVYAVAIPGEVAETLQDVGVRIGREGGSEEEAQASAPDPVDLIGLWAVEGAGEGGTLRLDGDRGVALFRDCGLVYGQWDANSDGLFLGEASAWSGGCGQNRPTPAWLHAAAAHRPDGDGHVLLDEGGEPIARLVPGEVPTVPPTVSESVAQPPKASEETRRGLQQAVALPDGLAAADSEALLGRWMPVDAPADSEAHAQFNPDDTWSGSDGCNDLGGRWRSGTDGAFLATGRGSTDIGCENIPVESRLTRAVRAGFDGDVLVLIDRQGAVIGRFEPS